MNEKNIGVTITVLALSLVNLDNKFWWSSLASGASYLATWWAYEFLVNRRRANRM